jgi:hypothetical protein
VTPAVDSRHAGASMSDSDFAKLQAARDAAPRGAAKANLHKRVQNEIARRKSGVPRAEPTRRPERDEAEQKVAKAQWSNLSATAQKHGGVVGPPEGGVVTVHFPIPHRAAGFYDQIVSAHLTGEFTTGTKTVRVHKP